MTTTRHRSLSIRLVSLALSAGVMLLNGVPPATAEQTVTVDTIQVSFLSPSAAEFDAGSIEKLSSNTLTLSSDVDWKLSIVGTSANFSCSGLACWETKPREDVEWREPSGSYVALSGVATIVTTGSPTTPDTDVVVIDYRILLDWSTDSPGTYNYDFVRYELSAL